MNLSTIDRRIFVVGVPRSGTTLVQSLLAAHSQVTSFTESHFFSRHFRLLPFSSAVLTRDPGPRLHDFLIENGVEHSDAGIAAEGRVRGLVPPRYLLPLRTRAVGRALVQLFDDLALIHGTPNWVEKTPKHLQYIPFIERLDASGQSPDFIHVIRDGLETVASLHMASRDWQRPYDLQTCVARWNADVARSRARVSSPNDHFVFYEELTSRPRETLQKLFSDLRLPWEPEVLERYRESSSTLVTDNEPWKTKVSGDIRRSGTSETALTEEQRLEVGKALRRDLYTEILERPR